MRGKSQIKKVTSFPSKITADYWVYAENPTEPSPTEKSGKWLLFIPLKNLDSTWQIIAEETVAGRLGIAAKAATAKHNPLSRDSKAKVICVYTYDFTDKPDVMRVRERLRELGFKKKIPYKSDQATRSNQYVGSAQGPVSLYFE